MTKEKDMGNTVVCNKSKYFSQVHIQGLYNLIKAHIISVLLVVH